MQHVDWLVTIGVFLSFVIWAFSFYMSFFPNTGTPASDFADIINDKVLDFLFTESYSVPLRVNSTLEETDAIVNFTFIWPGDSKESTRIYSGVTIKDCIISGDVVYFQSDLTNLTHNHFTITFSNLSMAQRCSGSFNTENATYAVPWSHEMIKIISQQKINEMTNQSFVDFRNNLSVNRDFRVEINASGVETNFGYPTPKNRNIYVRETFTKQEENNADTDIRVLVW
ncbi:MAG: hypothetical protein ABIH52_03915 [Candidatus Aenigmatarchaeota archaeon]|nr:hypothetical protein [Nanoarchaeota archaeon]